MKKTRLVFFGTPEFSATILKGLIVNSYNIIAVVTQPDQPVGRRQIPTPSPVKLLAQKHGLKVLTPKALDNEFLNSQFVFANGEKLPGNPILNSQLAILAAYGKIIPPSLLKIPKYGFLNIHPSLLPKYRGSSPIESAILNGEKQTGVTIIRMDEKIDHGPIVSQAKIKISPTDTKASLTQKLGRLATNLLLASIPPYLSYCQKTPHSALLPAIPYISHKSRQQFSLYFSRYDRRFKSKAKILLLKPQNHKKATYTKILSRQDGFIKPKDLEQAVTGKSTKKSLQIERQIRAFTPWPGTWTKVRLTTHNLQLTTMRLKILKAHLKKQPTTYNRRPTTNLVLDLVQLEGKKPVSFEEFRKGYPNFQFA